jgi:hypothetical protein
MLLDIVLTNVLNVKISGKEICDIDAYIATIKTINSYADALNITNITLPEKLQCYDPNFTEFLMK